MKKVKSIYKEKDFFLIFLFGSVHIILGICFFKSCKIKSSHKHQFLCIFYLFSYSLVIQLIQFVFFIILGQQINELIHPILYYLFLTVISIPFAVCALDWKHKVIDDCSENKK